MPANHQAVVEFRSYDGVYYRSKADDIGSNAFIFVDTLLKSVDFEEQAYKSCMGIINFSRNYGNKRVDNACKKAIGINSATYTTLKNILKNGQDNQLSTHDPNADTPTPYHENLRIGEWE